MYRKGKYTQKRGLANSTKLFLKRRLRWWKSLKRWQKIAFVSAPILAFLIITPIVTYLYYYNDIGDVDHLLNRNNTGVVLLDKNGKEFFSTGRAAHRDLVPLNKISDNTKNALIASEDKDFYHHGGFSPLSIVRTLYANVVAQKITGGGSTITQQLAKNLLLTKNQTILRKYQELVVAMAIEQRYSKDQVLDMYLNSVYYGENTFGIEDAAKVYFNKKPSQLDLAESAMLVGVLPAPSAYSPISGNPTYAKERQTTVLSRMVENGYITQKQMDQALKQKLHFSKSGLVINNMAPHFTEMVLNQLYDKYGEEKVKRSGYQVTTTLDISMQKAANKAVADGMPHINANNGSNASLVAIDPKTGEIRAYVGSADYNNNKWGKVDMVATARQPGSSFKPIYYSDALAEGRITPVTVLKDTPMNFNGYAPLDADRQFRGSVTVRQALNWSLNIPSVQVMQKETIPKAIDAAKHLGITTLKDDGNYGLALALGVAEVPLQEMTSAYSAFANGGELENRISIESIDDKYGSRIFTAKHEGTRAISEQGAYLISNILSDNTTRSRIFGNTLTVYGGDYQAKTAAVKTGTTEDSHDAWTIGYTPDIAVGVWVGNNDNTPMYSGGSDMAGPIWKEMMARVIGVSSPSFAQPAGVIKSTVCTSVGKLVDYFLVNTVPSSDCSSTTTNKKPKKTNTQTAEKCTVASKEDLLATDPNCVEDFCTVPGKENLAANDPNCVAETDTDGDGVPDTTDQCPSTPSGLTVDADGCPAVNLP